jgi:hypothetical protein
MSFLTYRNKKDKSTNELIHYQLSVIQTVFIALSAVIVLLSFGIGIFTYFRTESLESKVNNAIKEQNAKIESELKEMTQRMNDLNKDIDNRINNFTDKGEVRIKEKLSELDNDFEKLSGETLKRPLLEVLYNDFPLMGNIIEAQKNNEGIISLPTIIIYNTGSKEATLPSINISFNEEAEIIGADWVHTINFDQSYKSSYQLELGSIREDLAVIKPGERDPLINILFRMGTNSKNEIKCKLEIFYEDENSVKTIFTLKLTE